MINPVLVSDTVNIFSQTTMVMCSGFEQSQIPVTTGKFEIQA